MASALKDIGFLSLLLCFNLPWLSVAVGGPGNGAIRIPPPNAQTAMLADMMLHD